MFGEDGNSSSNSEENEEAAIVDKVATHNKFKILQKDYNACKSKAKNEYDFFNLIERCILGMEDEETPGQVKDISDEEFKENGLERTDMQMITQHIRVLSMQMQRYKPQEWNEFLIVALDSW